MAKRIPNGGAAAKHPRPQPSNELQESLFPDLILAEAEPMKPYEKDLFEAAADALEERDRALVDQLIADTRLYDSARSLKELLDFTARLRHLAPFNAMLLHIQKPGLSFAARQQDWWKRFRRQPKRNARPLGHPPQLRPVDFVYDLLDTEGEPVPEAVYSFRPQVTYQKVGSPASSANWDALRLSWNGSIVEIRLPVMARPLTTHGDGKRLERFEIGVNRNHLPASQLVTV